MNIVQAGKLLKTVIIDNVDLQQTLLFIPAGYLKQFSLEHCATFQELTPSTLVLSMVGKTERPLNRPYKLVHKKGTTWVSIPRPWLRNIGAKPGDLIELCETDDPLRLILQYKKNTV